MEVFLSTKVKPDEWFVSSCCDYKVSIDIDLYWREPPVDTAEKINREKIKTIIDYEIHKFLADTKNKEELVNKILSKVLPNP